ncbi:hypothetical protein jhhlp_003687 [Lomentospora prolificans]|uniref:Coupling of ubiquitin conjugation to ER degradation protein 1 n=1 Tax=Lomentospora prolificans TaxID=41688 RepID=A0A2N3N9E9_9PEZI|nr:hypothetical protein jhhlp_003687 [Lomentospora prolificans]
MSDQQVSLPFLIILLLTIGVVTRYLFFSSPTPGSRVGNSRNNPARDASAMRLREVAAQRIQQMFPQVDRRTILWDLQRNGGSIQATTERILAGRLETPPITFQPAPPAGSNPSASTGAQQAKQAERPKQPDLITRYNLQNKVSSESDAEAVEKKKKDGWSSNKDERQALLKKRRDEMILAARRKMEAKIAAEKAAAAAAGDASS